MAIKMVLFDLDGTLLSMDMGVFTGGRLRGKGSERQEKKLSNYSSFYSSFAGEFVFLVRKRAIWRKK